MAQRRKFSAEFKREAVDLTRRPQISVNQAAQELGVNANVLSRWRRELAKPGKTFTGAGVPRMRNWRRCSSKTGVTISPPGSTRTCSFPVMPKSRCPSCR